MRIGRNFQTLKPSLDLPNRANLVVLDADLSSDCRLRAFEGDFPNALSKWDRRTGYGFDGGWVSVTYFILVNSFAPFLIARQNEQFTTTHVRRDPYHLYVHYAGLIPRVLDTRIKSVRDISHTLGRAARGCDSPTPGLLF